MQLAPSEIILSQYRVETHAALTLLGDLHRVTDTRRNRPYALTVLPKSISNDPDALKQLEADSNRLRAVTHPNLVPHLGLFQTAKFAFLLEEWVDGPSLREVVANAPIAAGEALIYVKSICSALDALHRQGLLHTGISPELIRIDQRGEVFLGGLGAARALRTKGFVRAGRAHPPYAAPEQFNAEPLTTATDTYALAVILYELTTGCWINGRPAPKTLEAIRRFQLEGTPPAPISLNPGIPDNFSRMTLWALRKKPADRLKTTTELLSSLALAANLQADEIPGRADPATAPVTAKILSQWDFLPPVKPGLLEEDRPPLEQRLAQAAPAPAKKPRPRPRFLTVLGLAAIAGFLSLFLLIRPAEMPAVPTPVYLTPFVAAQFTPPPTITPTPKPTHAPGNRIAFTCTRGDYNQVCMINFDGTGLAQLSDIQASNYYPVFSPLGGSLLFSSNRNGAFDLYTLSFDERQLVQITKDIGNAVSPDYSPDGRQIVFANPTKDGASSIWVVDADGVNPRILYTGLNTIVGTAWSPDGKTIAYAMSRGVVNEYEIFLMDSDGKNNRQISRDMLGIGGSLDWSPDGKYLLIYAGPAGDKDIFRLDIATGGYVQLTDGGNNAAAAYSRDGDYIAFNSLRNDDQADLYVMKADGSLQRRLTNNPEPDWGPVWEP